MPAHCPPLSEVLPPLIFGCGTFNTQFHADPYALPAEKLVSQALELGIRAFDTSPYYGPSETILGQALKKASERAKICREDLFLLTKVGRIAASQFDYSPPWIRKSILSSLERLRTKYLDVVYCHDVEFVSPSEVLAAVRELRRIRDQTGTIRFIGISGYPLEELCALAELILAETGEPLDAVMTYAHYTLQNRTLLSGAVARLAAAQVGVVPNASVLGMGMLRRQGVPAGGEGDWHPAPPGLRAAVQAASRYLDTENESLEKIAFRASVEGWMQDGACVGTIGEPPSGIHGKRQSMRSLGNQPLGVSVVGLSSVKEIKEDLGVWRSILDSFESASSSDRSISTKEQQVRGMQRRLTVQKYAEKVREILGEWADYTWSSPPVDFVKGTRPSGQIENGGDRHKQEKENGTSGGTKIPDA